MHSPYWANSDGELQKGWAGMEAVQASGKTRSIGVSNFEESHLKAIFATAKVKPNINQIGFHSYLRHSSLQDFNREHGNITISAYGPLHPVTHYIPGPLDATLESLAKKYSVAPGLICM